MKRVVTVLAFACVFLLSASAGRAWAPVGGNIMTRWAADVSPTNPHPEYPRPTMTRPEWRNLNGLWQFRAATEGEAPPVGQTLPEEILVPFAVESALSGIKRHEERMWYRRTFDIPASWADKRVLLHFGAVDWLTTVTVNGKQIGSHRGGYDGFSFDITSALNPTGPQELIVYVFDPTDKGEQPRGKQVLHPEGIWYTPVSGIWQTVWLEPVPASRIASLRTIPHVEGAALRLTVNAVNAADYTVRAVAMKGETEAGAVTGPANAEIRVPVPNARLWSPSDPFLYDLRVELRDKAGQVVDTVGSYFGMRSITLGRDDKGITRPMLNGEFVFQVGPLDQGYWPDGLYTAPTDEALRYDLEITKQLGFNMTRKHIKIEPERWYYWADKLGLLVWQDLVNGNATSVDGRIQLERETRAELESRWNHPSIIMWVVFNEGWGQYDTVRLTNRVKRLDPSRLANNASGWTDAGAGDVIDWHIYPGPASPNPEPRRAAVLGEYGGLGLVVPDHLWNTNTWSYAGYQNAEELMVAYEDLQRRVYRLKDNPGLSAVVYTQITDVEGEVNGLLTYDRLLKVDVDRIARLNKGIIPPLPPMLSHTSEEEGVMWRRTTTKPAADWMAPNFNASGWSERPGGFGTAGTPGAIVRTTWNTGDIWLRREFNVTNLPAGTPFLRMHHDEDAEVYLNGVLAASVTGYTTSYRAFSISPEAAATLKKGKNVLAVHCRQTTGGQYIDVGLGIR